MSEYKMFIEERDKIDYYLQKGYQIKSVTENLSGAFVDFYKKDGDKEMVETLHVITPEGRKYFSVMLIKQQKEASLSN